MVEAAGVEPAPPQHVNWLMARDFRRNCLTIRCLVVNSLSSGVHWSPLESSPVLEIFWRRTGRKRSANAPAPRTHADPRRDSPAGGHPRYSRVSRRAVARPTHRRRPTRACSTRLVGRSAPGLSHAPRQNPPARMPDDGRRVPARRSATPRHPGPNQPPQLESSVNRSLLPGSLLRQPVAG